MTEKRLQAGTGPTGPTGLTPLRAAPRPQTTPGTAPLATQRDTTMLSSQARAPKKPDPLLAYPTTPEQIVAGVMKDAEPGIVQNAVNYWHDQRKEGGVTGVVGAALEGLLTFSGLPAVENSAGELGARMGAGDTNAHIALAGGKLALNCGVVLLNGMAAGKAVTSAARGLGAAAGAAELAPTVVRHYTSAAAAEQIMKDGVLLASKNGLCGADKVYLLAEEAGSSGMNLLRRSNVGLLGESNTARAIEIDLTRLPPELAATFKTEAQRGVLNLEHFVTHAGAIDLKALGSAVKVVDTQAMAVTFDQILKSGGRLLSAGSLFENVDEGAKGLANAN